jgi:hypothetical protein
VVVCVCVCVSVLFVCVCREAAGGEGARDTESKTRTPHKVVGKNIDKVIIFIIIIMILL